MKSRAWIALGVAACACGGGGSNASDFQPGRVGSSIVVLDDGARIAVANVDHGSVSIVDATTLTAIGPPIAIGEGSTRMSMIEIDGSLFVTGFSALTVIDVATLQFVRDLPVCAGAAGIATNAHENELAIACEWDQVVVRLDRRSFVEKARTPVNRPRAVAFVNQDIVAAEHVGGHLVRIHPDGSTETTSLVPTSAPYRPALTTMTANLATSITPAFGALHVTHLLENHTGDASVEKIADDYGSVADGNPKINPAVTTIGSNAPVLYAKFDGGTRVFNGPIAAAPWGDRYLIVANVSSDDVTVIDTTANDVDARVVASFAVGAGPHGVAVDEAHQVAYVDNTFDRSISRIDLSNKTLDAKTAPRVDADLTRVRAIPSVYSPAALAGRKLFYDAKNTHVTPSGVVVCATCHPDGGDDGLVWFVHTSKIPLKRRRTPHLGNAHTSEAPFHWDGAFATMHDLAQATMTDLMAGDGLLVDLDTIQAYIDEMVVPPIVNPDGPGDAYRGQALFSSVSQQCATCHAGSDLQDGMMHAPLDPMSLSADDVFTQANTPSLRGVFLRAPYFHDGRSPDLRDLLTRADAAKHGSVAGLSSSQIDDLIAYLRSL
jgi:YVTN family beta-propeller protein